MLHARRGFLLLCLLSILSPLPALADTIETASHVSAATIFSDRALVTRSAKIRVPQGAHIIALTNMPAGFDEASLRVKGKGGSAVKIGTVDVKTVFLAEQGNDAEREKTAALEAKMDEKASIEGEVAALKTREVFINRIVGAGADNHDKDDAAKLDFAPEKWAQAWTLIQNGMAETERDLAAKAVAERKIDADTNKLRNELAQINTLRGKERRDVDVSVEAASDTDFELEVTYQTAGATWRPVYDARLDTTAGAVDLEQYGLASQQTGEDWNDIDLTFSTSQPATGSEMPRIAEWMVSLFQPSNERFQMLAANAPMAKEMEDEKKTQRAMPMSAPIGVNIGGYVDAAPAQATVQATEYAADFKVAGKASMKSVRDPSKMFIGAVTMKASFASQVSPRLTPQAFLFAKITNGESYPLVSGTVSKYRDGTFIGNAGLSLLRPNETANLSFGVDDRVKVTYQRTRQEETNPLLVVLGDMKIERDYETKVQNLHKDPIVVTVFEQYPVSSDPDVKAELIDDETTQGYQPDTEKRQGVITWSSTLQPKEEKAYTLGFRVKFPKNRNLTGL